MKLKLLVCGFLLTITSCSSVRQVANDTYEVKCDSLLGNCQKKMEETCPGGYKVTAQDTSYGFGGFKDIQNFVCEK